MIVGGVSGVGCTVGGGSAVAGGWTISVAVTLAAKTPNAGVGLVTTARAAKGNSSEGSESVSA